MTLPFVKMHGLGNDFVLADGLDPATPSLEVIRPHLARIGDRRFGVGYDQFLFVARSEIADFAMPIFNSDGSEAEMCGNGIRAFAKYVFEHGHTESTTITVETLAGIKTLVLHVDGRTVDSVRVDMGAPALDRAALPMVGSAGPVLDEPLEVDGEVVRLTGVSMGNPHVVFFADPLPEVVIDRLGPKLETHPAFPRRTNVHAVQVHSRSELTMLTWERGAGRTLACGTGACAVGVAAALNGLADRSTRIHLKGGDLRIDWGADNHVFMTGPATEVYTGTYPLD